MSHHRPRSPKDRQSRKLLRRRSQELQRFKTMGAQLAAEQQKTMHALLCVLDTVGPVTLSRNTVEHIGRDWMHLGWKTTVVDEGVCVALVDSRVTESVPSPEEVARVEDVL